MEVELINAHYSGPHEGILDRCYRFTIELRNVYNNFGYFGVSENSSFELYVHNLQESPRVPEFY